MMNRRTFLQVTGIIAAGQVLQTVPLAGEPATGLVPAEPGRHLEAASAPLGTSLTVQEPGTYQVSGLVRLEAPVVEISGIANAQRISWSGSDGSESPVAGFVTFERFDRAGAIPDIQVRGGQLEALTVVLADA